jgi:Nuclease-related domain
MILKEVVESPKMEKLRLILKRYSLEMSVRKEMENELARSLAGFKGEQSLQYHLSLLPSEDCLIFHDLRIPHGNYHFQLDILIMTTSFFLIIEVKNMAGTLIFDREFHQLHRILNNIEETFPDPISQLYRQTFLLREWLKRHHYPDTPVESIVIISNPNTSIKSTPGEKLLSVTHSSYLLPTFHTYQKTHQHEILSRKELKKISRQLLKQHTPSSPDLYQQYNILKEDILKGVRCDGCDRISMVRLKRKWFCLQCGHTNKTAHVESLKEYAQLISPFITTRECGEFLQVPSQDCVKHLLSTLHLPTSRMKRKNVYHLDALFQ